MTNRSYARFIIAAQWMGCREIDPTGVRHCILLAARRKNHYICDLLGLGCNLRRTETHIRSYLKAEAYGEEYLIPANDTRSRKSKIQKILEIHPQLLHKILRKEIKKLGMLHHLQG